LGGIDTKQVGNVGSRFVQAIKITDVDDPPLLGSEQQLSRSLAIRCPACLRG